MLKKLPKISIALVIWLTFVDFTTQEDLYEGSTCTLHTGDIGVCKIADNCKWLEQNLQKKKMKLADIRRCSFTNDNRAVACCGDEHPNKLPDKPMVPCELGYLFDSYNCDTPVIEVPSSQKYEDDVSSPTPPTIPLVTNQNKFSGSKLSEACAKYADLATPYFPSNIINGKPAGLTEFPHMAALGYGTNPDDYSFDCGGTLVADNWVVTAAHCIKDRRKPVVVRMGKVTLHTDDDAADAIDVKILRILRHPMYSLSRKKNDIALIEFEGTVEFNDIVRPACIRTEIADLPEDRELFIAGWGSIEAERTNRSEILLKANVTNVPLERCNQTLVEYNRLSNAASLRALSDTQMCAINPRDNSDACQGDSGGPLFLNEARTGLSTIVGIVSFGVSCGSELPGVYTRIAKFTDWIEQTIWPTSR